MTTKQALSETAVTASLQCINLQKRYPGQEIAFGETGDGVSIEVEKGELFALIGPSGCGKTTMLRLIGGFIMPDRGSIRIEGRDVTALQPYHRPTSTVFQNYALFPNLRLDANVAFGLKMQGVGQAERLKRADEALELVGLGGMGYRKISELSGGQQQRAALARALAVKPAVLLLDEPLGALDLKLRRKMQDELSNLKKETSTTFIHVTHDQEEACAIADRIAVMDRGRISQISSPQELYTAPRTTHVARFINLGTIVKGTFKRSQGMIDLFGAGLTLRGTAPDWLSRGVPIAAVVPRSAMKVSSGPVTEVNAISGVVERCVFTGTQYDLIVKTPADRLHVSTGAMVLGDLAPGKPVSLSWRAEDVVFVEDTDGIGPQ